MHNRGTIHRAVDVQGLFEGITTRFARGWVVDVDEPDTALSLELMLGDRIVGTARADIQRADIRRVFGGIGTHGFRIPIPAEALDLNAVRVRVAGTDIILGKAQYFSVSAVAGETPVDPSETGLGTEVAIAAEPVFCGQIDEVSAGQVRGWAIPPAGRAAPARVDFLAGKVLVGTVLATDDRPDVEAVGAGPLQSGFDTRLRLDLISGQTAVIARVRGGGVLSDGMFDIEGTAAIAPRHHNDAFDVSASSRRYRVTGHPLLAIHDGDRTPQRNGPQTDGSSVTFGSTHVGILDVLPSGQGGLSATADNTALLASLVMLGAFTGVRNDQVQIVAASAKDRGVALLSDPRAIRTLRSIDGPSGLLLTDLAFVSALRLRLILSLGGGTADIATVALFQLNADGTGLDRHEAASFEPTPGRYDAIIEIDLLDPLRPLLMIACDFDGRIAAHDLIPFPSLARGGLHEAELLAHPVGTDILTAMQMRSNRLMEALWRSTRDRKLNIAIDENGMIGNEPVLNADVLDWARTCLNAEIGVMAGPLSATAETQTWFASPLPVFARDGFPIDAFLPSDALPSLSLLVEGSTTGAFSAMPYVAMDIDTPAESWLVQLPRIGSWLDTIQPQGGERWYPLVRVTGRTQGSDHVSAIRHLRSLSQSGATVFFPTRSNSQIVRSNREAAKTADTITVFVSTEAVADHLTTALECLAEQTVSQRIDVVLYTLTSDVPPPSPPSAERLFGGRVRSLAAPSVLALAVGVAEGSIPAGDIVVLCADSVLLHDTFTLETLIAVARAARVGLVGCLTVTGSSNGLRITAAGTQIDGVGIADLSLRMAAIDPLAVPIGASLPVAGPPPTIWAMERTKLHAGGINANAASSSTDLAIDMLRRGYTNICVTDVSVFCSRPVDQGLNRAGPQLADASDVDRLRRSNTSFLRRAR